MIRTMSPFCDLEAFLIRVSCRRYGIDSDIIHVVWVGIFLVCFQMCLGFEAMAGCDTGKTHKQTSNVGLVHGVTR